MGAEVCRAVTAADDLTLVAAVDAGDPLADLSAADVVVDFTHPDVVMDNLHWCIADGRHCVVGPTGFTPHRIDEVRRWLADPPELGVVLAPNFGLGAVLMRRFAQHAHRYCGSA